MLPVSSTSGDKSAPDELRRFKLNSDSMSWSASIDGEHARLLQMIKCEEEKGQFENWDIDRGEHMCEADAHIQSESCVKKKAA